MHMRSSALPLSVLILLAAVLLPGCLSFDDHDGDGIYDSDDPDDDNDGLPDNWEKRHGFNSKDKADGGIDPDGDGLTNLQEWENGTDPNADDTDEDGIPDDWEIEYGLDPTNSTGADLDEDGDTLSALEEYLNSTAPNLTDTDGDGVWDGYEVHYGLNPLDPGDAALDGDFDGLNNTAEFAAQTDPNLADTDWDGMPDGWEVEWGTHPLVDDGDDNPDEDGWDADRDLELSPDEELTNLEEYANGTDPLDDDTDGDGMDDGYEVFFGLDPDDEGDRLDDPDGDGLTNLKEARAHTSPVDADTDGDGMDDAFELEWDLKPVSASDAAGDLDGDAFTNLEEYKAGTNISDPDTDRDGVLDGHDVVPLEDIAIKLTFTRVEFEAMVEGAIDNPQVGKQYEVYVRVTVAGIEAWTEAVSTSDLAFDAELVVVVNIPDNLRNVSIVIALWENDTVESAGLNADDHLDVDGTSDDLDCDIVYDLLAAVWRGDTATGETDGHADGLPPESEHPDALLRFAIEVVAAG